MDLSNQTHKHHSPPTHQKIVEILAGTANGCLSELGYFPGMPQRLKELEQQNEQRRLENMKLYQDNASLLDLIEQQNERIRNIRAPDSEKDIKITELTTELQKTRTQRDDLARALSIYNYTPSQLQQNFAHLQGDYVKIITGYRVKCTQVEHLQDQVRTLTAPRSQPQSQIPNPHPQAQQQSQQQSRSQVFHSQALHQPQPIYVPSNHPAQRQSAPLVLQPHIQKYVQQQLQPVPVISRPQPGQQTDTQPPPVFVHSQKQKYPLSQTQQTILEQRYHAILQSQQPRSRPSSGSMPTSTRSSQDSFVNMANPQQHGPLAPRRPNSNPPHSSRLYAAQSTSPMVPAMPDPLITQPRSSFSNPPTPIVPSYPPLSQLFFAPSSSNFSVDSPTIAMPPSNRFSPMELLQSNTSTFVPPTTSPQDTPADRAPLPKDVQRVNVNTSSSTGGPISPVVSQLVNVGLSPSIPPQIYSLKRDSLTGSEGHHDLMEEQLQKRPRLEEPQLGLTTNAPIDPVVDDTEDTVQMDIDEDEVVEVGPDGLRLVKDCISDLFGEEGEGKGGGEGRYCKLCIARRTMGYRTDSPKPFINATNDELQEHCVTEHAEAWDALRQSI